MAVEASTEQGAEARKGGEQQRQQAPAPSPQVTGGAAILARLRAQRAASVGASQAAAGARRAPPRAAFLYASQTGTGQEIAKSLAADAASKGVHADAMSLNELGWANFGPEKTPVVVVVASSTGDGDPPDNSAAFYVQLKKQQPADRLRGVKFAVLGLGDSNYTRFMYVPRIIRNRMLDLGAIEFHPLVEADEVDGLESKVDPWCDNLWGPLKAALAEAAGGEGAAATAVAAGGASAPAKAAAAAPAAAPAAAAAAAKATPAVPDRLVGGVAPEGVDLSGVPALAAPRVEVTLDKTEEARLRAAAHESSLPTPDMRSHRDEEALYSAAAPFYARVAGARLLTAPGSDRVVIHCELDVASSRMNFTAGDSVGVIAQNDPDLVDALIERLGLEGGDVLTVKAAGASPQPGSSLLPHVPAPCTLRHALTAAVDLTGVPRKSLLRTLAEHCTDDKEKRTLLFLCSRGGREDYQADMVAGQPTLLDILNRFKSCSPPLSALLDALPPLAPRMYSICAAPTPARAPAPGGRPRASRIEFAFSLVTVNTPSGTRRGVATGWLRRVLAPWLGAAAAAADGAVADGSASAPPLGGPEAEVLVPVFLRPSESFGPPKDLATPMVMVGPGTGVAPFRGFVQQRLAQAAAAAAGGDGGGEGVAAAGESWLYFGCRRREEDYLFGEELEGWRDDGSLSRLRVAFSREGDKKTYVQHLMAQDGAELARLVLERGAHVYVCGDGAAMARDVHSALAGALRNYGGLSEEEVGARLKEMAARGAYVRDVWCA